MDFKKFYKMLRSHKVPLLTLPHSEPEEVPNVYRFSPITRKRTVKRGSCNHSQVFRLKRKIQERTFNALCSLKALKPYTIGISSVPNDLLAIEIASLIHYKIHNKHNCEWQWFNAAYPLKYSADDAPKLAIFYNITEHSNHAAIRSFLYNFPKSLKLVVVSGMDALKYFDDYLYMPVTSVIHCTGLDTYSHPDFIDMHYDECNFPALSPEVVELLKPFKD